MKPIEVSWCCEVCTAIGTLTFELESSFYRVAMVIAAAHHKLSPDCDRTLLKADAKASVRLFRDAATTTARA